MGLFRPLILKYLFPRQDNWKHIMVKTDNPDSIRHAIRELNALLPEEERKKNRSAPLSFQRTVDELTGRGVYLINHDGKRTFMTRNTHEKFLKVMDFLHENPDGYVSVRKTGEQLGVSHSQIANVKAYWEENKAAFAAFREREAHQKAVDAGDEPPF